MHSYDVDLKSILINSKHSYDTRSGFIVSLFIDDYVGYGEVAPLNFFSQENCSSKYIFNTTLFILCHNGIYNVILQNKQFQIILLTLFYC